MYCTLITEHTPNTCRHTILAHAQHTYTYKPPRHNLANRYPSVPWGEVFHEGGIVYHGGKCSMRGDSVPCIAHGNAYCCIALGMCGDISSGMCLCLCVSRVQCMCTCMCVCMHITNVCVCVCPECASICMCTVLPRLVCRKLSSFLI